MWHWLSQISSRSWSRLSRNWKIIRIIRLMDPRKRLKRKRTRISKRNLRTLKSQISWNRRIKSLKRLRMVRRKRITRISFIRNRKSQKHHRWIRKSQLFLIKRKHRFRLSIFSLLQTRQNLIQKIILVQNLQLISLNHLFRPRLS